MISGKLRELDPIRNAIAHNRVIEKQDVVRLNLHADDIVRSIDKTLSDAA